MITQLIVVISDCGQCGRCIKIIQLRTLSPLTTSEQVKGLKDKDGNYYFGEDDDLYLIPDNEIETIQL